ncbi:CFC_HP_G0019570.mRNA.1.CDS.1 [Saccharomyces cerevisiae]|nr:CFC_HP_G0019570.mRNA.1.CDS.1 [Saccharomyces cerevisiae]CAI6938160.1 CFC_HP_G0019570.mRNA.1.CDS.1 [Saccharomyces cerevisiae]
MTSQEYEPIQWSDESQTNNDSVNDAYADVNTTHESRRRTTLQPNSTSQSMIGTLRKYARFIGPGRYLLVAAGSAHRYKLLFSVLVSNFMAAFWQYLCARLGAVTGLDLAQNCKKHLPFGLNITLYILGDENRGKSYKPNGSMKGIRIFEAFVSLLVVLTVVCFTVELFYAKLGPAKEIFSGFLPSKAVFEGDGLYLSLAILGATVMPHSLYLGSGVVQPRLREYDIKNGHYLPDANDMDNNHDNYRPSYEAISETLHFTITELLISLFTVALFVNYAILIVSGATLYGSTQNAEEADLFSIYNLLCSTLSKGAGTVFVLALLFSGQSAGIVCTLSGQMVSEGFLNWTVSPALRRSATRAVAITPCLILVLVAGRSGLSGALNASQVVLSLLLPFVSAPLLYFTSSKKIMRVQLNRTKELSRTTDKNSVADRNEDDETIELEEMGIGSSSQERSLVSPAPEYKDMSNGMIVTVLAIIVWLIISGLNFYMLLGFTTGKEVHL